MSDFGDPLVFPLASGQCFHVDYEKSCISSEMFNFRTLSTYYQADGGALLRIAANSCSVEQPATIGRNVIVTTTVPPTCTIPTKAIAVVKSSIGDPEVSAPGEQTMRVYYLFST